MLVIFDLKKALKKRKRRKELEKATAFFYFPKYYLGMSDMTISLAEIVQLDVVALFFKLVCSELFNFVFLTISGISEVFL